MNKIEVIFEELYSDKKNQKKFINDMSYIKHALQHYMLHVEREDCRTKIECDVVNKKAVNFKSLLPFMKEENRDEIFITIHEIEKIFNNHLLVSQRDDVNKIIITLDIVDSVYSHFYVYFYCRTGILKPVTITGINSCIFLE